MQSGISLKRLTKLAKRFSTQGGDGTVVAADAVDLDIHPWGEDRPVEEGKVLGAIVSHGFLGRTVRLEVQLRHGQLVTPALPKHQALDNDLTPGRPDAIGIGQSKVFPTAGDV